MPNKGLKDLLKENLIEDDFKEEIKEIKLSLIKPNPYQPRYVFEDHEIDELANSIKENGLISPIIVKKMGDYYVIIAGERRYRACKKLHFETIPAIIRQYEKSKMMELALIENIQRENLSPIEEAKALNQIMRELDLTQMQVAKKIGKTRSYVTNMLGLLSLPDEVLKLVDEKKLTMGHARALSKLMDKEEIKKLANQIYENHLSVRETEKLLQGLEKKKAIKKVINHTFDEDKKYLSNKYHANVSITGEKTITLKLKNKEDLIKIIKLLKDSDDSCMN